MYTNPLRFALDYAAQAAMSRLRCVPQIVACNVEHSSTSAAANPIREAPFRKIDGTWRRFLSSVFSKSIEITIQGNSTHATNKIEILLRNDSPNPDVHNIIRKVILRALRRY